MDKGKNPKYGKTNQLNPNFQKMQDHVADSFKNLGFVRGNSLGIDNPKHKSKSEWVKSELTKSEIELVNLKARVIDSNYVTHVPKQTDVTSNVLETSK